jgi:hypothetical protein
VGDVAVVALDVDLPSARDVEVADLAETSGLGHLKLTPSADRGTAVAAVRLFGKAFYENPL